jgi:aerobic-type carbon monoxide dehydrogenase small subunit (CoxS/CutS family)
MADAATDINITINGTVHRLRQVPNDLTLLDLLHEELGLTGTKFGCGIGACRACTVAATQAADAVRQPTRACVTPAALLDGQAITTVEGLATAGKLSPLQQSFLDLFAFQCGYCAPGFLMAAHILLEGLKHAPVAREKLDAAIERACGEHVCRCTGYKRYYEAIRHAAISQPGLVR